MIQFYKQSPSKISLLPDTISNTNKSNPTPGVSVKSLNHRSQSHLNHFDSFTNLHRNQSRLRLQQIGLNEKYRFDTRPSTHKSFSICENNVKTPEKHETLKKKVKFSPDSYGRKISITKIMSLVKADLPALPQLEKKARLYTGLDKEMAAQDSNHLYMKYLINSNHTTISKKSVERLKRKKTLLLQINKSPYSNPQSLNL